MFEPNIFGNFDGFSEISENFKQKIFTDRKIFIKKVFLHFVFIFVKYMNVAFQQAIGHLLTPSGRGERAI